jgi:CheY-like chemotaxis protein
METPCTILLAEDDEADVLLLERAFEDAGVSVTLQVARDGQECVDYLEEAMRLALRGETVRVPCLLLLDLKMSRLTGIDVLQWRRSQPILRTLPVVVFSSSGNQQDVEMAYALGVNAFAVKPPTTEERADFVKAIDSFWLKFNRPPLMCTDSLAAAIKLHATNGLRRSAP